MGYRSHSSFSLFETLQLAGEDATQSVQDKKAWDQELGLRLRGVGLG